MIKVFKKAIKRALTFMFTDISLFFHKKRNNNGNFTLISRGCIGGDIYQQYGMQYLSPTIALFFSMNDFNYFCLHLKEYLSAELKQVKNENCSYPIGMLAPDCHLPSIIVNFMHYKSFNEAYEKWTRRKKRVNYENIYVVNSCTYQHELVDCDENTIKLFNSIPYKKVIFVNKHMGFDDEIIIKCTGNEIFQRKKFSWKRQFNTFNFNKFLKR